MHHLLASLLLVTVLVGPGRADAQAPARDKAAADAAFRQGKRLIVAGKIAAACAKFEGSLKLMDQLGVRLNLADCYERLGRLSAAYAEFRTAEIALRRAGDRRARFARRRIASIDRRMPRLTIELAGGADKQDLSVTRDGVEIDHGLLGTPLPVDPGRHVVVASAPGHHSWKTEVDARERSRVRVDIPVLEPDPTAPPVGAAGADDDRQLQGGGILGHGPGRTRRIVAVSAAGTGAALLGTGLYFGLRARSQWNDARADGHCDDDSVCDPIGYPIARDARRSATTATILVSAGLVAAGAGVYLYLTAPDPRDPRERESRKPRVVPMLGPDATGVALTGRF
jgi:hypothetical protein